MSEWIDRQRRRRHMRPRSPIDRYHALAARLGLPQEAIHKEDEIEHRVKVALQVVQVPIPGPSHADLGRRGHGPKERQPSSGLILGQAAERLVAPKGDPQASVAPRAPHLGLQVDRPLRRVRVALDDPARPAQQCRAVRCQMALHRPIADGALQPEDGTGRGEGRSLRCGRFGLGRRSGRST
jgi:hypothetical protein